MPQLIGAVSTRRTVALPVAPGATIGQGTTMSPTRAGRSLVDVALGRQADGALERHHRVHGAVVEVAVRPLGRLMPLAMSALGIGDGGPAHAVAQEHHGVFAAAPACAHVGVMSSPAGAAAE